MLNCNKKEFYTKAFTQSVFFEILLGVNHWKLDKQEVCQKKKKNLTTSQHIHYTFELFSFLTLKMLVYVGGHVTWDASYRLWCALRRKASHFLQTCRQTQSIWTLIHSSGCSGAGSLRDHLICSYNEKHLRELCEGKTTFFS